MRRLALTHIGLGLVGLAALVIGAPNAAPAPRPSVVTLLTVRGSIDGFAQDGHRIVWANAADPCRRRIHIRALSTGATANLPCGDDFGAMQDRMALAGMRALWATVHPGNTYFQFTLYTAAPGDRKAREVGDVETEGGRPVPVAGDRATLAYADISDTDESEGAQGVFLVARRRTYLPGTEDTSALAASGRRLALARRVGQGCRCNQSPSWSPHGRRILFLSTRGSASRWELYAMNADGSGLRRLTSTGGRVRTGSWSPDGRALVYSRQLADENEQVIRASADGRGARLIARGTDPQWSPDGRFIAYSSFVAKAEATFLFVVSARGGKPRRLTKQSLNGGAFTWSRDSRRIAFVPDEPATGLSVVNVASRSTQRIVRGRTVRGSAWSRDGTRIAYCSEAGGVHVIRANGTGDVRVARAINDDYCDLKWSPDSGTIAFTAGSWYEQPEIHVVPATGGTPVRVALGRNPGWSSDGRNIAYVTPLREGQGEIARMAAHGSAQQVLTSTKAASKRNAIEIRLARGRIVSGFDSRVAASGMALSGSRVALLIRLSGRFTVEIRTLSGSLVRTASVRRPSGNEISMSRRWVVFRTGTVIRALDIRSGRQRVLARAGANPVGLSIEGRRVAWAEQGTRTSAIRAVFLP